jgi:hypothetical protein
MWWLAKLGALVAAWAVFIRYFDAPEWVGSIGILISGAASWAFDEIKNELGSIKSELQSINRKLDNLK